MKNKPLDSDTLKAAVGEADLRVLLMVLYHFSGDEKWLQAPYLPRRDVQLIADEDAGFAADTQQEIRAAAVAILSDPAAAPVIESPDDAQFQRMMDTCLGERVDPDYVPMMREQMGFSNLSAAIPTLNPGAQARETPVLIVGAGVSGIVLGKLLLERGIDFRIIEKNCDVGGTWLENTYPGCGVDTPNHAYSFSFGPRHRWSRYFSSRDEIQDYLKETATNLQLYPHIQFDASVIKADWDEAACCWQVSVESGGNVDVVSAWSLVSAVGQLNEPAVPAIRGMENYAGQMFHSARWPQQLDLAGKRVAIIGTGASAMQIVPTIADEVAQLAVYQRSPQWARPIPRYHDHLGDNAQWLLQEVPFYAAWFRFTMLWRYGDGLLPYLHKDPDWPHAERSLNRVNERHRLEMASHIERSLAGRKDLIARCTPDYPPYGKRILLDNGWYQALLKDNVELLTESIDHLDEQGVVSADGSRREVDVVVLATGFQVGKMAARLNITGRDGRKLDELWAHDNPSAYLGISVAGFPNLFCMLGPNSSLGHGGSAIFQSECQARYITSSLVQLLNGDARSMEVKEEVQGQYVARVDAEHERMIWTHPGVSTYYRNSQGRVFTVMPWSLVNYWHMTHAVQLDDYRMQP
jgi:4-hydroxyacetophenone monooxygenase